MSSNLAYLKLAKAAAPEFALKSTCGMHGGHQDGRQDQHAHLTGNSKFSY